ncbi:MAG TPA: SOS response-associated peptidase [Caldisericia bacterium]|jgi:putative SOS response-associated peptidase YedK|nr:SOS response-associated peptidase [Caldisericia bacterium]
MCGRFALANPSPTFGDHDISMLSTLPPRYNIAPRSEIYLLAKNHKGVHLEKRIWGVPLTFQKGPSKLLINAKSETAHEKKMFRDPFFSTRCVILATGFFEWDAQKQPYYFFASTSPILGLAGFYRNEALILTKNADSMVSPIHARMPVIIHPAYLEKWLDLETTLSDLQNIMNNEDCCSLEKYPVSQQVNSPKINSSSLIEPIQISQLL